MAKPRRIVKRFFFFFFHSIYYPMSAEVYTCRTK